MACRLARPLRRLGQCVLGSIEAAGAGPHILSGVALWLFGRQGVVMHCHRSKCSIFTSPPFSWREPPINSLPVSSQLNSLA